jgi:hypothetical protein
VTTRSRAASGAGRWIGAAVWLLTLGGSALFPQLAKAERCDSTSHICIVNPPTAASPWIAPQLVQLRLPAEARPEYSRAAWTQTGLPTGEWPHPLSSGVINNGLQLLEQGPPGGMSLYQATLQSDLSAHQEGLDTFLPVDGVLTLTVTAGQVEQECSCIKELTATFESLPVFSAIANFNWHIARGRGFFKAIMSFEARTPVHAEQSFHGSGFSKQDIDFFPLPLMEREVTASGPVRIVQKLSIRYVRNRCRGYRRCELVTEGELQSVGGSEGQGLLSSISRRIPVHRRGKGATRR